MTGKPTADEAGGADAPSLRRPGRRVLSAALGLATSALVLVWLLGRVDLAELGRILAEEVALLALAPVVAFDLGFYLAKTARWREILAPVGSFRRRDVFEAIVLGATSNNVLPLRLDELVRVGWLTRHRAGERAAVLGTVVVDRLCDLAALGLATLGALAAVPGLLALRRGLGLLTALIAVASGALLVLRFGPRRLLGDRIGGLLAELERGVQGLVAARWPRLVLWTVLEWTALAGLTALTLRAFGLGAAPAVVLTVMVANYLSFAIPSGPGSLGVFEALVVAVLQLLDPGSAERHLAFALVYHALLMIPVSGIGVGILAARTVGVVRRAGFQA